MREREEKNERGREFKKESLGEIQRERGEVRETKQ